MFREGFILCFCFSQVLFNFVHISFHFLHRFIHLLFLFFSSLFFFFPFSLFSLTFCSSSFSTFMSSFSLLLPFGLLPVYPHLFFFFEARSCARFFKRILLYDPVPSFFLFPLLSLPPNLARRSHHARHQCPLV